MEQSGRFQSEGDLRRLVADAVDESTTLEFKAIEALANTARNKKELAKDVSAMANSSGGSIIYGLDEKGDGIAGEIRGDRRRDLTVDWIDEVLNSGISPRVEGLRLSKIETAAGTDCFVIDVPDRGRHAPHQAVQEARYFRRYNRQILSMSDHEVRDILSRRRAPDLYVEWRVGAANDLGNFDVRLVIGNRSTEPALYSSVELLIGRPASQRRRPNGSQHKLRLKY